MHERLSKVEVDVSTGKIIVNGRELSGVSFSI